MAAKRPSARSDLAWGFGAQALQYGAVLLLLPILAARMSSQDVGLWFVFMTIQSLVLLLDLGFGYMLARNFAYIFAGASRLLHDGVHTTDVGTGADAQLLATTIRTAQLIYAVVASVVALMLLSVGTFYIGSLGALDTISGMLSWGLFALAVVLNIYFQWYLPLLMGSGRVRQNYKAVVIVRGGFAALAALTLFVEPSLVGVSASYLCAVLMMLVYARVQTSDLLRIQGATRPTRAALCEQFGVLWKNSYRMGLVSIGAFMITKYSVLLVSSHFGLAVSASYAITLQLFSAIGTIAAVPFNALLSRITERRLSGDQAALKRLLSSGFLVTWLIGLLGIVAVVGLGHELLAMLHSKTNIVEGPLLLLIALTAFLELNHATSAWVIASANRVPFVPAALISGAVIMVLSTIAAAQGFSLLAIVAIQTLTQAAYNNWRWPLQIVREYHFRPADFVAAAKGLVHGRL